MWSEARNVAQTYIPRNVAQTGDLFIWHVTQEDARHGFGMVGGSFCYHTSES